MILMTKDSKHTDDDIRSRIAVGKSTFAQKRSNFDRQFESGVEEIATSGALIFYEQGTKKIKKNRKEISTAIGLEG